MELRDDLDYERLNQRRYFPSTFPPLPRLVRLWDDFGWQGIRLAACSDLILIGSILIGGVHDFTALVASIRHKARALPKWCAIT